jgi:gliding motility-associated-like protein
VKIIYCFVFLFVFSQFSLSQTNTASDCVDAVNICTNATFSINPSGAGSVLELAGNGISNPTTNPGSGNAGCLLAGELNSTWMVINIASTGNLEFSFGTDNSTGCLDWIMWPYSASSCNDIINNNLAPIRCNWNGACEGFTGVATPLPPGGAASNFEPALAVNAGEQYLICLSNYSSQTTNLPLDFFGTADVSCTSVLIITVNDATICPGDSTTLTASGAVNYTWSPGGQTGTSITVSPSSTTVYTVTGTEDLGNGIIATGSADATVTVLAANDPLCSCTVTASNSGPICFNETFDLNATAVSNGTYQWEVLGNILGSGQNLTNIPAMQAGTYPVQVTAIDVNGFVCTDLTQLTILSSTDPQCMCTVTASNSGPICEDGIFDLNATSVSNGTYYWEQGGNVIGNVQNALNMPATGAGTIMFHVIATDDNGFICIDSTEVIFNPLPNVSAGLDQNICYGENVSLDASGAQSYSWHDGIQWLPAGQSSVVFTPSGNITYMVLGIDVNNCENSDTVDVYLNAAEVPNIDPLNNVGCVPYAVELNNAVTNAQSCLWEFSNGLSSNGCGLQNFVFSEAGCYDLTFSMVDIMGCDTSFTYQDIVCVEEAIALFNISPNNIGPGNSTIHFYNESVGAEEYLWLFGDGNTSIELEGSHQYNTASQDGYIATLVATSPSGCIDSASLIIGYEEQLIYYIPNSFTPDADEHNQSFKPIFTSGFDPFNFEMTIYNRWGEVIWLTHDHSQGWDGSYGKQDSFAVQAGIYSWVIRFKPKDNDEKIVINGFVNVLK